MCTPFTTIEFNTLSPQLEELLKEFGDVFTSDNPTGLSPFRGIYHQINFVTGASLPNRPAYRTNPKETRR